MLLNAAERSVVGLGWFLALHMMQPPEHRRVLVLDDPAGGFDSINQAGFMSTLRAFVRLLRPDQLVLATHDEALALMLEEELEPVAGWPKEVFHLRCSRDEDDRSVIANLTTGTEQPATFEEELTALGLIQPVESDA